MLLKFILLSYIVELYNCKIPQFLQLAALQSIREQLQS